MRSRHGYQGKPKRVHRSGESLAVKCLRDGTLTVNVETGEVFTTVGRFGRRLKEPAKLKTRIDEDGYEKFSLQRECRKRRPDSRGRRVHRQEVFVHRAVWMAKNGNVDIAPGHDINHRDRQTANNCWRNLEISTKEANSGHRAMTLEEQIDLAAYYRQAWGECA